MTVPGVEADLSRARLQLLDKRKEIRETVHQHFRELVAVSDHALLINEKTEGLCNSFARMTTLSRALRLRAASARLAGNSPNNAPESRPPPSPRPLYPIVDAVLSVNGRILSHIRRSEFNDVAHIIETQIPELIGSLQGAEVPESLRQICKPHISTFPSIKDRVTKYCLQAIASDSPSSLAPLVDCIRLLRQVSGCPADMQFWAYRERLLENMAALPEMVRAYDLTIAAAQKLSLAMNDKFVDRFGSSQGHICTCLYTELHQADAQQILARVIDLKQEVVEFRSSNKYDMPTHDIYDIIEAKTKELVQLSVRRTISELGLVLSSLDVSLLEASLASLTADIAKCDSVYSHDEVTKMIGKELDTKLSALAVETDRGTSAAVACGELIACVAGDSKPVTDCPCMKSLKPFLSVSIDQLTTLEKDSFDLVMDEVALGSASRCQDAKLFGTQEGRNRILILNYATTTDNQVEVPAHVSAFVYTVIFDVCVKIVSLPVSSQVVATRSAKSSLCRFFSSFFNNSSQAMSIQTLFDLHVVALLTSSPEEDPDHDFLSSRTLESVQGVVLSDPVDLVLYKELLRKCAMNSVSKNSLIFQPLLSSNPAAALIKSMDPLPLSGGSFARSLVAGGDRAVDRFNTLPVSRSAKPVNATPQQPVASNSGDAPSAAPAFNLTSFFNQVGKITLGSK